MPTPKGHQLGKIVPMVGHYGIEGSPGHRLHVVSRLGRLGPAGKISHRGRDRHARCSGRVRWSPAYQIRGTQIAQQHGVADLDGVGPGAEPYFPNSWPTQVSIVADVEEDQVVADPNRVDKRLQGSAHGEDLGSVAGAEQSAGHLPR